MAGLYSLFRGPHTYYLNLVRNNMPIKGNPNALVNLLHYEDAATVVLNLIEHPGNFSFEDVLYYVNKFDVRYIQSFVNGSL